MGAAESISETVVVAGIWTDGNRLALKTKADKVTGQGQILYLVMSEEKPISYWRRKFKPGAHLDIVRQGDELTSVNGFPIMKSKCECLS